MVGTLAFRALGDPRHLWPCRRNGFPSNLLSSSSGQVYRVFNEKAVPRWLFWIKGERWPGFNRLNGAKEEGWMDSFLAFPAPCRRKWRFVEQTWSPDFLSFFFLFLLFAGSANIPDRGFIPIFFFFFSFFSFRDNQPVQWRNFFPLAFLSLSLSLRFLHGRREGVVLFSLDNLEGTKDESLQFLKNSLSTRSPSPPLRSSQGFVILRNRSLRKRDTRLGRIENGGILWL